MAKSKGKGKGKSKGKKAKPIVDGVKLEEMKRPALYGHCKRLQDEILKEIEERNKYMLEGERFYIQWQLLMEKVDEQRDKLDLLKSHMEDTAAEKEAADATYQQKLRFLKAEQSKKMGEVRLFHLERMKLVQDDAWNLQNIMRDDLFTKRSAIRKAQMALFEIMRSLHLKHAKELSEMRKKFSEEIRVLEQSFDDSLFHQNDLEDEIQVADLGKIVTIKEDQLKSMYFSHEIQLKDLKSFFNELTLNNLTLIAKMELELKQVKVDEIRQKRVRTILLEVLTSVADPINTAKEKMVQWEIQDEDLDAKQMGSELKALVKTKARLQRQSKMMEYSNEALIQRTALAEKERDALRRNFSNAIVDIQRKMSMTGLVIALQRKAANREAQLFDAISKNLEHPEDEVDHYKDLLDSKDAQLKNIKEEVTDAATDYKTTRDIYKEAYTSNVIDFSEIGFPLLSCGAKPRDEDENNVIIFDGKSKKGKRGIIHTQESAEGGSKMSEDDASKSSMTSSQNTSELRPTLQPSVQIDRATHVEMLNTNLRSQRTKSFSHLHPSNKSNNTNSTKGKTIEGSPTPQQQASERRASINTKFLEHIRLRQKRKKKYTKILREDSKN